MNEILRAKMPKRSWPSTGRPLPAGAMQHRLCPSFARVRPAVSSSSGHWPADEAAVCESRLAVGKVGDRDALVASKLTGVGLPRHPDGAAKSESGQPGMRACTTHHHPLWHSSPVVNHFKVTIPTLSRGEDREGKVLRQSSPPPPRFPRPSPTGPRKLLPFLRSTLLASGQPGPYSGIHAVS